MDKLSSSQKDILLILYNRRKRGIIMDELQKIMNTPELLDKERKLARFNIKKEKGE